MNEKNKNEKTFSDLFSNIDSNSPKKENNSISFNDIIEQQNTNTEPESVTMESLFNKSITNQEKKEESINDAKEEKIESNPTNNLKSPIFDTFEKKEEQENLKEATETPVSTINNDENILIKPTSLEEPINTKNIFFDSNTSSNSNNNIFELKEETSTENQKSNEISNKKSSIFDSIQESQTEEDKKNNIFEDNNQENTKEEIKSYPKIDFEENNNIEAKEKDEEITHNENIFFDSSQENTKEEIKSYSKIDFEDNKDKKNNQNDKNPFFEDDEPIKSASPFFEDSKKEEQPLNPFFDNKINLDETKKHNLGSTANKIDTSNVKKFDVKIIKKREPLIKFILGVISYAIFILLLLIGITLLLYIADIKVRAAKGDHSSPKYNAYVVLTGSMLPEIKVYDVVITKKTEPKDLEKGDVITFASSDSRFMNTIITHRIIKKNYDSKTNTYTFQTKGDNNNVADNALVEQNNIYGKVILKIPKLGYLQHFLAQDGGYILVVIVPCLIVISYDIVKLLKGLKRKKYKNIKVQK